MSEVIVAVAIAASSLTLGYVVGFARGWHKLGILISECADRAQRAHDVRKLAETKEEKNG